MPAKKKTTKKKSTTKRRKPATTKRRSTRRKSARVAGFKVDMMSVGLAVVGAMAAPYVISKLPVVVKDNAKNDRMIKTGGLGVLSLFAAGWVMKNDPKTAEIAVPLLVGMGIGAGVLAADELFPNVFGPGAPRIGMRQETGRTIGVLSKGEADYIYRMAKERSGGMNGVIMGRRGGATIMGRRSSRNRGRHPFA